MPNFTLSTHFNSLLQSGQHALALEQLKTLCQSLPAAEAKAQASAWLQEPEVPWQKIVQLIEAELAKIDQAALKVYALALGDNNIVLQNIIGSIINIGNIAPPKPLAHQLNPIPSIDLDTDCIGRETELVELAHKLSISNKVALVKGLGGIGKTTLAQAFVTLHQKEYQHLVWVNQGEDLIQAVALDASLAHSLNMPFEQGEDLNTRFTRLMQKLRAMPGPNLLVIDNATEKVAEREAFKLLPKAPNWKVLVTSRQDLPDFLVMELHPLKPEAALSLFRLHHDGGSDEEVMALLEEIGFHTLMIELIAKTLRRKQGTLSVPQLLDFLKKRKLNQPELEARIWARHSGEESGVFQYLMGLYELADLSAEEVWVLQQFAVLPSLQLKPDLLAEWLKKDAEELNEVLNDLADRGWLGILQDQYLVHPLVQEFVKYRATPGVEELGDLVEAMGEKMSRSDFGNPVTDNIPWVVYAEKVAGYFEGMELLPEKVAGLGNELAAVQRELGQYESAVKLLRAALESGMQHYGLGHPNVVTCQSNLALVLKDLGEFEKAAELFQTILEADLHYLGTNHPAVAISQSNLAGVLNDLGQYQSAAVLFEAALECDLLNFGPGHPSVAKCQSNLAGVLHHLGQYEKAAELLQSALECDLLNFGPEHPSVARCQSNLALVLQDFGQYERAAELLQVALESNLQNFGPEHPNIATCQSNLALVLQDLGQYEKAEELLNAALLIDLQNFDHGHPNVANRQSNLALLLQRIGQYERAAELHLAALESYLQNFGPEHPNVATCQSNLALVQQNLGQYEAAAELLEAALKSQLRIFGPRHPKVAKEQSNLANVFKHLGKYESAIRLLQVALESDLHNFGSDHPKVATRYSNLALVLQDLGQYERAAELLQAALESNLRNFGAEHPNVATNQSNLALVLQDLGQYERAAELLQAALESNLRNFGSEHPNLVIIQYKLASVYYIMGQFETAITLLSQAMMNVKKSLGIQHQNYKLVAGFLEIINEEQKKQPTTHLSILKAFRGMIKRFFPQKRSK